MPPISEHNLVRRGAIMTAPRYPSSPASIFASHAREQKLCRRCHNPVECPELYDLCDACHEADRKNAEHYQDCLSGKELDPRE